VADPSDVRTRTPGVSVSRSRSAIAAATRSTPTPKSKPKVKPEDYKVSNTLTLKEEITLPETITVKEFSEKLGVPIGELIKAFISNKMMLSLNSSIDYDTASLIAEDFGVKVNKEKAAVEMQDVLE